jgi:nickel superoxide dismutase
MRLLASLLEPKATAHAHCDLPCGVYDPAQARIEAESVKAISEKYQQNTDPEFRARAIYIKEQRSELVKHHLWVLWTDYFKPPHFEKYPQLNQLFNEATKLAGAAGIKVISNPVSGGLRGRPPGVVLRCVDARSGDWPRRAERPWPRAAR